MSALLLSIDVAQTFKTRSFRTSNDTQRIKEMYLDSDSEEIAGKKAVMGALTLYLDFINLFLLLLQLFGQRRQE